MPIPEAQPERRSHQGAVHTPQEAYELCRFLPSPGIDFEVYLQGSYKNDTNIYGDSYVDIVVQLNSAHYSNLTDCQKRAFRFVPASYGWDEFRSDVLSALRSNYGPWRLQEGKKSIKVQFSHFTADVVVCIQYRHYRQPPRSINDFIEGMTFYVSSETRWVINHPKLHYANGIKKNQTTCGLYKPTVRIFKNARTYMIVHRGASQHLAPSYFLECLLYNVPNDQFRGSFQNMFCNIVNWLMITYINWDRFRCQNEQQYLFGSSPEQWSKDKARRFLEAIIHLWNNWR